MLNTMQSVPSGKSACGGKTLIFLILLTCAQAYSQWQPDVRLTNNNPAYSYTSSNNAWCIAASGDSVHVVWFDSRSGIYYKRSTDGGVSWGTNTTLTHNTALYSPGNPSISVSGSIVHVVWEDYRDDNWEIYYKRSTDGGVNWGADMRLTNNTARSRSPSVSVSGQVVHVVFDDSRYGSNTQDVYYKRSTDGGVSWGADTRLTEVSGAFDSHLPSTSVSGSVVHVVWYDLRDGNAEIYYKRSTDGGVSWGADTRLTNDAAISVCPSVSVSGSVVHVVWHDTRHGPGEIYYKRSTDGGVSWGPDTRLTNDPNASLYASVSSSGSVVHVVWQDSRDGGGIYYKRSTDGGISWGADTRLTNNSARPSYSSVAVSGSVVHVVWNDARDGNPEIYYKRNPTGNVTGIKNIGSELPEAFNLEQNYPNPFNPSTTIKFSIAQAGFTSLRVFNILGQEVATLVNEELKAGSYEVKFDASGLSSGVYFYKVSVSTPLGQAGSFSSTKKMLLTK